MNFKIIGIILIYSINLFSIEMDFVYNELKECQNYQDEDNAREGIFDWINSVDNIEQCDMEQIDFISSNRNRLTVKSNLSLLKSKYEFCDGVESLGRAFQQRESKILDMKKNCKNHTLNKFGKKLKEHHEEIIELQDEVDELIDDMDK